MRRTGVPLIPLLVQPAPRTVEKPLINLSRISMHLYVAQTVNSRRDTTRVTIDMIGPGFWRGSVQNTDEWNQGSLETCLEWAYQWLEMYG